MPYTVDQEYYNAEFDFYLYPGDVLVDGDLEPDLMANLQVAGVLVADGAEVVALEADDVPEEDEPLEDEADEEDE